MEVPEEVPVQTDVDGCVCDFLGLQTLPSHVVHIHTRTGFVFL